MASNYFGRQFRITTWGESHGKALGVVIDGCPAGIPITDEEINVELRKRRPGRNEHVTPRQEKDLAEIYSGVFEGKTTGAPISIIIFNQDADSAPYEAMRGLVRPGHAQYTYLKKYGVFDDRGGGRASARETVCRVAAGAVAKKILSSQEIRVVAFLKELGGVGMKGNRVEELEMMRDASPVFCPDPEATVQMVERLQQVKEAGDSVGGIVEAVILGLPPGIGDPIYAKLEARLADAMLSIPATKGFEIGSGFEAAQMQGSLHNDPLTQKGYLTNHAGGVLGGISTGMPLIVRVAFKPTSSVKGPQRTITEEGEEAMWVMPEAMRHDPCVALRGVPVVEAMGALVIADALLCGR